MDKALRILFFSIAMALFLFQGWVWYFAPCSTVEKFWAITHTPARCI